MITDNIFNKMPNVFWDEGSFINPEGFMEYDYFASILEILKCNLTDFESYDLYFFVNLDRDSVPVIQPNKDRKSVLFWIGEENGCYPSQLIGKYDYIFKCHLREERPTERLYSLPIGFPSIKQKISVKPINNRKINVFYSGNLNNNRVPFYVSFLPKIFHFINRSNKGRLFINRYTKKLWLHFKNDFSKRFPDSIVKFNNGFAKGYPRDEYIRIIADSKIVLSPLGFYSPECFRTYEALKYGCVVLAERHPNNEHYKNSPIIYVKDWDEGINKVEQLLNDTEKLESLSEESLNWYNSKLSPEAVARFICSKLEY